MITGVWYQHYSHIKFSTYTFFSNNDTWERCERHELLMNASLYVFTMFHHIRRTLVQSVWVQTRVHVGVSSLSEPECCPSTEPSPGSRLQRQRSDYLETFRCLQAKRSCWDVGESLAVDRLTWCGGQPAHHKSRLEKEGRAWRSNPSALANYFNPLWSFHHSCLLIWINSCPLHSLEVGTFASTRSAIQ